MRYRTIMDRFGDKTLGYFVVVRDLHNRWMVYGVVEHSYRNQAICTPVGCGNTITIDAIKIILGFVGADHNCVRIIDDDGKVYTEVFSRDDLAIYKREKGGDFSEDRRTRIRDPV